jgi:hypothetical protein
MAVVKLLLSCTSFSEEDICALLKVSTNKWIGSCRKDILDAITKRKDSFCESEIIEHTLRGELNRHLSFPGAAWALSEKELEPYKRLLSDIEPKDVVLKYRWMFEDMYLRLPQKREMDFQKECQIKQEVRNNAVKDILAERGRIGIWELVSIAKYPSSVINSMIQLYGDGLLQDVCLKFCENIVDINFLQTFFQNLFFQKNEDDYVKIIEEVKAYGDSCFAFIATCLVALQPHPTRHHFQRCFA